MKRILFLLFLISCTTSQVIINDVSFDVELARTDEEKSKGLMFREQLPENQGMLFFFDDMQPRGFWMKNTLIPLDMIYVDEDYKIVEIKHNVQPCEKDPCPSYISLPAKFVLEINAGLSEKKNIQVGDYVKVI